VTALDLPRVVFSGDFQADVSTVNNDVRHYDTATFEPRFQQVRTGPSVDGAWNPSGSGAFRLLDCTVRGVVYRDGTSESGVDPALPLRVTGAGARVSGKLVDLDPQWQLASEIWGLGVRLEDADGGTVFEAEFEPASFRDIGFGRQASPAPNGQSASAVYTSRLASVRPGLTRGSRLLDELLATSEDGTFAIRLTTFGYFTNARHPRFTLGRVLGAIGPGGRSRQPRRFILGRRLAPANGAATPERLTFVDAVVDDAGRRVGLDLGNALPLTDPFGTAADIGPLSLAVLRTPDRPDGGPGVREGDRVADADLAVLGTIDYRSPDWLARTAGIVDLPLAEGARALVPDHPIALVAPDGNGARVVLRETFGGLAARADDVVLRIDARSGGPVSASVAVHAARWGVPLPGATIRTGLAPPMSGQGGGPDDDPTPPTAAIPDIGTPPGAVELPAHIVTGPDGRATLPLVVHDPGNPRRYLDGQVYLVTYGLAEQAEDQRHWSDMTFLHVRDAFPPPARPTWVDDIRPLFAQYGNLYPIMSRRLVDLGDYDAVREEAGIIELAFSRPLGDPNHMPVTRELSEAKRAMILSWLRDRNAAGERRLVHGPRTAPGGPTGAADAARTEAVAPVGAAPAAETGEVGGKALALPRALEELDRVTGDQNR
jgi:hypothetical protein